MTPAVLYARADSDYKSLEAEVFDVARDSRTYAGTGPVVAHPPCRTWGSLRFFTKAPLSERELGRHAVGEVRRWGGVLEHPARSLLWADQCIPEPTRGRDRFGGWSLAVDQFWFGHRANKPTWLYVVGVEPRAMPEVPFALGRAPRELFNVRGRRAGMPGFRTEVTRRERDATPLPMARWLLEVARRAA